MKRAIFFSNHSQLYFMNRFFKKILVVKIFEEILYCKECARCNHIWLIHISLILLSKSIQYFCNEGENLHEVKYRLEMILKQAFCWLNLGDLRKIAFSLSYLFLSLDHESRQVRLKIFSSDASLWMLQCTFIIGSIIFYKN